MDSSFTLVQELLRCIGGLSFEAVPASKEGLLAFINRHLYGLLRSLPQNDSVAGMFRLMQPGTVYEVKSHLGAHFIVIKGEGVYYVAGPCLTEPYRESVYRPQLYAHAATAPIAAELMRYYRQLPVIPTATLRQLGTLLGCRLLGLPANPPFCLLESRWEEDGRDAAVEHYTKLLPMRQLEQRYACSRAFLEAVSAGNASLAYSLYRKLMPDIAFLDDQPQPLRSAQNLCIVMNAQLRSAAEKGGVHPLTLDEVSRRVTMEIEAQRTLEGVQHLSQELIKQYCRLVQQRSNPAGHPRVRDAVAYLQAHLSENLQLREVARQLEMNPDYLSHLFVEEMGMPFTEYVRRRRMEQAQKLLRATAMPIQKIAAMVGYNHASYFTRQFTEIVGTTPKAYRVQTTGSRQRNV